MSGYEPEVVYVVWWTHSTGRTVEWFFPTRAEADEAAERIRAHRKIVGVQDRWFSPTTFDEVGPLSPEEGYLAELMWKNGAAEEAIVRWLVTRRARVAA